MSIELSPIGRDEVIGLVSNFVGSKPLITLIQKKLFNSLLVDNATLFRPMSTHRWVLPIELLESLLSTRHQSTLRITLPPIPEESDR